MKSENLALLAGDFHLHFLNRAVAVHVDEALLIFALEVFPHIYKSLLDHVKFLCPLPVVNISLRSVLLLDSCDFLLVLVQQLLRFAQQFSSRLTHVLVFLVCFYCFELLLNHLRFFVKAYV